MGFLDRFSRKIAASIVEKSGLPRPRWMERDPRAYTKEGYQKNVIVFRCVDLITKSLAMIPMPVFAGDDDVSDTHPLSALLKRPNPLAGGADFWAAFAAYRMIVGNSYIQKLGPDGGVPNELWLWTPYEMKVVAADNSPVPRGYVWDDGKPGHKHVWEVDFLTGKTDILHWKTFHPGNPWYGMSPLEAAAWAVDQHNSASEWNQAMLQNGAEPSGTLTAEGVISPDQFKQMQEQLENRHISPKNARRPMILQGGLKWQQTALTPKEMDWLAGKNLSANEIAAAFGVPGQLVGIQGSQTFANYAQARQVFWEDTVIPLMDDLVDELNRWLVPSFQESGLRVGLDLDGIPALEEKRQAKWLAMQNADFLTINEKREAVGYDKIEEPDADRVWLASGKLPIGEIELDNPANEQDPAMEDDDFGEGDE